MKKTIKNKIINDPIYGIITLKKGIILELINNPLFQRLRRISQLGLSYLVYPGAHHTRFHHAIGAMHLMQNSINEIKNKGHIITKEEEESLLIAILLHDIGHGPFSHALENSLVKVSHEKLSVIMMEELNYQFSGKLTLSIEIFKNLYSKRFLHQLVSSQLDMDRLDYLRRDSFYTGVTEGNIGTERIIKMFDVVNDNLVVEEKGIYSIEKFLIARRLMYWQVYLHKTVISFEYTLIKILQRARYLVQQNIKIYSSKSIIKFLNKDFTIDDIQENKNMIHEFGEIDDHDIYFCIKEWVKERDYILSSLSKRIILRKPLKIIISENKIEKQFVEKIKKETQKKLKINKEELEYLVFTHSVSNKTYTHNENKINIITKDGVIKDIAESSDQFDVKTLTKIVNKHFICFP
ncbi:MAG: phosphohydrolase [Flavobacteriales bacterium]|nr:phosphohydrolase [Flavobacteriales bacterium]